ncbi:MAG: hypothetical protein HC896_17010 [Bacteroidales bacterium]|nr:hypothetical protein [Bacteroidales bacterium]
MYFSPEIRISLRYLLATHVSIKTGFHSLQQNIHQLSNATSVSPTDIWRLSDSYLKPQKGYQLSGGYFHNFPKIHIETSVESYYKWYSNLVDFKTGADILLNDAIENELINAEGHGYGVEVLVKG